MNKEYIEFIRFETDDKLKATVTDSLQYQIKSIKRSLLSQSLRVTKDTVSSLYEQITTCASILDLEMDRIEAYIYSKPDHNAFSISESNSITLIAISSSLIKILDNIELRFLIGHELGHALLNHSELTHSSQNELDYETVKHLRNMEISADRIGYICAMSLDHSITAMMKIASGLDGQFVNTDIRPFIDQSVDLGKELRNSIYESSSHPPLPLRARALVWLSTMEIVDKHGIMTKLTKDHHAKINSINKTINHNISEFLDQHMSQQFESSKKFLSLLLSTLQFSEDGILSKREQQQLIDDFGQEAKKMFILISELSHTQVTDMLLTKLKETFNEMVTYSSDTSNLYLQEYCKSIGLSKQRVYEITNFLI